MTLQYQAEIRSGMIAAATVCVEVMRIKTVTSPNVECSAPGHSSYVATPGDPHSQAATGCFQAYLTAF